MVKQLSKSVFSLHNERQHHITLTGRSSKHQISHYPQKWFFFWLKTKFELVVAVIREECTEYFCLTQSTNIQEGITANYTRHAGSNSNRKSWVPADGVMQRFWHSMSAPGFCGSLPALTSLAWQRSRHLVPVGGGTSCPCIAPPRQTIVGPHTFSVLKGSWSSLSLQQSSGKRIHTFIR